MKNKDLCPETCPVVSSSTLDLDLHGVSPDLGHVIQNLKLLFDISQDLQKGLELKEIIQPVLQHMADSMGLYRGTVTILNRQTGEMIVDEAHGLSSDEITKEHDPFHHDIMEQVIKTGKPVVIADIHAKKADLNKPAPSCTSVSGLEHVNTTAFLCIPIALGQDVMGTLSIFRKNKIGTSMESDIRLLTLIAQLIAQAAKLRQTARENINSLRRENQRLLEEINKSFKPDNLIGNSRAMQMVYHHIEQVANSNTTVLIRGESGVGKELVAHAIHAGSSRAKKAFVKINCAALPESIVESELFGHEKGAFTSAIAMRKGKFELAHGGTIFLDEIGELSLSVQAKLLRVLQERELERVGGTETIRCDVRVIAATNRSLEEFMEQKKFRLDLYYRLNVFPIYVPPLNERKTDILQLANFFIEKYSLTTGKIVKRISTPAIDMMMSYHWPGNVRELENCIERAMLLSTDGVIHGYHLPPTLQTAEATATQPQPLTLKVALETYEREQIVEALKQSDGVMASAARQLGLTERIMGLRAKKYGIDFRQFRTAQEETGKDNREQGSR